MVTLQRYNETLFNTWNGLNEHAKNGIFLFDRNYMDYHADRFEDHSYLFYKGEELLALFPASVKDGIVTSHGGLTYGGFILHTRATADFVLESFTCLLQHLKSDGLHSLIYKVIPYIFHKLPAQEDLYALFRNKAQLIRRDISSVIDLSTKPNYTKGTKYNISKARKSDLQVVPSMDFEKFMAIEEELLMRKYRTKPTHSPSEMLLLANRFPENINLLMVYKESNCLGGTILFLMGHVVHTQYIGITDEGKLVGALDVLTDYLINRFSTTHKYFSFGISTEQNGELLNEGLIRNKESFGARAITNDFYKLEL
jgi:hypothetical protein